VRFPCRFSLLLAVLLVLDSVGPRPASARVTIGDTVPALRLSDWQGHAINLADLRGRVVVIDFWASWCTVCRQALPSVDGMARRFAGAPVAVIGINIDRTPSQADHFLADYLPARSMTLLHDPEAEALARFGAEGMPAIYVVDPRGIVRFAESGYQPERLAAVENAVTQYLSQASHADPQ
jgi:thiol-disulfide isomerase/thioredoxin